MLLCFTKETTYGLKLKLDKILCFLIQATSFYHNFFLINNYIMEKLCNVFLRLHSSVPASYHTSLSINGSYHLSLGDTTMLEYDVNTIHPSKLVVGSGSLMSLYNCGLSDIYFVHVYILKIFFKSILIAGFLWKPAKNSKANCSSFFLHF